MSLQKLPKLFPKSTIVWIDLEGVLMEKNISFYLLFYKPTLALNSLLKGLIKALTTKIQDQKKNFRRELIKECKKVYETKMNSSELYLLGKKIFEFQSEENKRSLMDFFYILKKDGYDVYIITNSEGEIAKGFLANLPEEIRPSFENFITSSKKAEMVSSLRKYGKNILGIGDTYEDEAALKESDVACVVSSLPYKLMPCKIEKGYKFKSLNHLESFFDAIYMQNEFLRNRNELKE